MEADAFAALKKKLLDFMDAEIYPNELLFLEQCEEIRERSNEWTEPQILADLKQKAKALGLWNVWMPNNLAEISGYKGGGLSNMQYGELCEIMGSGNHMEFAPQAMNCASPDTGNMETLGRFATPEQKEMWLKPLLEGNIRSCFAMTEPAVASSDATNISISIAKEDGHYVINGRKWWITGAGNMDCKIMILMGKTDPSAPSYTQQSCILVPMDTPGITLIRPMAVIGDVEAPKGHMDILFEDVRVPIENILAGEGRGSKNHRIILGTSSSTSSFFYSTFALPMRSVKRCVLHAYTVYPCIYSRQYTPV
jgi:alkylation response protein AidB-like acyl-CoA dehydrogenase